MRVLVTGCAGFIGSHLVEALLERGDEVVGIDCFTGNYARERKLANLDYARTWSDFRLVERDLTEGPLRELLEGCSVVFHLAGEPGVRAARGATYERNNVAATARLLAASRAAGVDRFVLGSSSSVYGGRARGPSHEDDIPRPASRYAASKLRAEQLCRGYAVTLRYFTVYGPRQRPDMAFHGFGRAAVHGEPLRLLGDGRQTRDFTYVSDAVAATVAAARWGVPGRVYNVAGGSSVTLNHAVGLFEEMVERPLRVLRQAPHAADVPHTAADLTRARVELGYEPAVTLAAGLRTQLDWLRADQLFGVIR